MTLDYYSSKVFFNNVTSTPTHLLVNEYEVSTAFVKKIFSEKIIKLFSHYFLYSKLNIIDIYIIHNRLLFLNYRTYLYLVNPHPLFAA